MERTNKKSVNGEENLDIIACYQQRSLNIVFASLHCNWTTEE